MKWSVRVGVSLTVGYDDIEADSIEEAKQIARVRALEDIDFNNAELDEYSGLTIYCAWSDDEEEVLE